MDTAILVAIAASFCTATASPCQRNGGQEHADGGLRQPPAAAVPLGLAAQSSPRIGQLADVYRTARRA